MPETTPNKKRTTRKARSKPTSRKAASPEKDEIHSPMKAEGQALNAGAPDSAGCDASSARCDSPANSAAAVSKGGALEAQILRIKQAKSNAEEICRGRVDAASASVDILFEMLFDYLCNTPDIGASEMGTLSSVVQRLVSSRSQLANMDIKASGQACHSGAISEETIKNIESALKLL